MVGIKGMKNNGQFKKGQKPWNYNKKGYRLGIPRIKPNTGFIPWNKGLKGYNCRNKHYNWKGGIAKFDRLVRQIYEYKQWRSDVFQRDNWTCQTCGERGYLEAHHIKEFHKILKENNIISLEEARKCNELWDLNNGVSLCIKCHNLTKKRGTKKCIA
jgi:hypothetical protein